MCYKVKLKYILYIKNNTMHQPPTPTHPSKLDWIDPTTNTSALLCQSTHAFSTQYKKALTTMYFPE